MSKAGAGAEDEQNEVTPTRAGEGKPVRHDITQNLNRTHSASASQEDNEIFARSHANHIDPIYFKGTSKRIYGELYKVIDSSDVILHVLDARDPFGTMCESVLDYLRKEKAHKQVVLVINKCDLVPNWVTVSPLYVLASFFPLHHEPSQVLYWPIWRHLQKRLLRSWEIKSSQYVAVLLRHEVVQAPAPCV